MSHRCVRCHGIRFSERKELKLSASNRHVRNSGARHWRGWHVHNEGKKTKSRDVVADRSREEAATDVIVTSFDGGCRACCACRVQTADWPHEPDWPAADQPADQTDQPDQQLTTQLSTQVRITLLLWFYLRLVNIYIHLQFTVNGRNILTFFYSNKASCCTGVCQITDMKYQFRQKVTLETART